MNNEYVVRFEIGEINGSTEEQVRQEKQSNPDRAIKKQSSNTLKNVSKGATLGIAATKIGTTIYQREQATINSIRGDNISQARTTNTLAKLNEGLGVGGTLGIAALTGNPAIVVAAGVAVITQYAFRSYNTLKENQVKIAQWQIEESVNREKRARLVQYVNDNRT